MKAVTASIEKLGALRVRSVYPGHGRAFAAARLRRVYR